MADQWTDFGSGFEDTGDGRQLETDLFATGGVFGDEVKADAFEAVAAAQPSNPPPPPPIEQTAEAAAAALFRCGQAPPAGRGRDARGRLCVLRRLSRSDQEPFPPSVSVRPRAESPFAAFASDHDAVFLCRGSARRPSWAVWKSNLRHVCAESSRRPPRHRRAPLDGVVMSFLTARASAATSSPRNDLVKNYRARAGSFPRRSGPPQTNTVSVAFQSPLNGECWWDPLSPANGVCARTDGAEISVGRERGTGPRLPREAVHLGTAKTARRPRRCG